MRARTLEGTCWLGSGPMSALLNDWHRVFGSHRLLLQRALSGQQDVGRGFISYAR
jgi:hypothetical protein